MCWSYGVHYLTRPARLYGRLAAGPWITIATLEGILYVLKLAILSPTQTHDLALLILGVLRTSIILTLTGRILLVSYGRLTSRNEESLLDQNDCWSRYGTCVTISPLLTSGNGERSMLGYLKLYILLIKPPRQHPVLFWLLVKFLHVVRDRLLKAAIPLLFRSFIDGAESLAAYQNCFWFGIVLWISKLGLFEGMATNRIQSFVQDRLADLGQSSLMAQTAQYRNKNDPDELAKAIEQGSDSNLLLDQVAFTAMPMVADFVLGTVLLAYLTDAWIVLNIAILVVTYIMISFFANRWLTGPRRLAVDKERTESRILHTSLRFWRTISIFLLEQYTRTRYAYCRTEHLGARRRYHDRFYVVQDLYATANTLTLIVALMLALNGLHAGSMSPGTLAAVYTSWKLMTKPLAQIADLWPELSIHIAYAQRLLDIIAARPTAEYDVDMPLPPIQGRIVFDNVSFGYPESKDLTIKDVNLIIEPGQVAAFVGRRGSGKSTLMDLLLRMHEPTDGRILIDGHNIRRYSVSSLRQQLGVVSQATELFDMSTRDNVRLGKLDASDEKVRVACQAAVVDEQVIDGSRDCDEGLCPKLSGGEAQGIALARTFLREPRVLILDEATSAVDSKTEAELQESLHRLSFCTRLTVAHRLSTIKGADVIVVLDKGMIIEKGTHEELLAKKGAYHELWTLQGRSDN